MARPPGGNETRHVAKLRAQEAVLEALRHGKSIGEASSLVGVSRAAYGHWRSESDDFAVRASEAVAAGKRFEPTRYDGSFASFRKKFFGMDSYRHHLQIVKVLNELKPREVFMILLWPEAGKTTTITDWICKSLAEDPNRRITCLSESQSLTRKIVGQVQNRMTDARTFPDFIASYGPFVEEGKRTGKPWSAEYFTVAKAEHDERDYSLEARAVRSKTYGTRIDDLIVDDVISRETVNQSEAVFKTLRQTYLSRGRKMRTLIVGTRIEPGDLYEKIIEEFGEEDWFHLIELPALEYPGMPEEKLYCPEMWVDAPEEFETREAMIEEANRKSAIIRRQVGEEVWQASYQQNPQAPGVATFSAYIEDVLDWSRKVSPASPGEYVVASLDPALGGGNALMVAVHSADEIKLIDLQVDYGLARTEQILSIIETHAMRYKPQKLVIEENAFQKGLVQDTRLRDIVSSCGFTIHPHQTGRNKMDDILGVAAMAGTFMRNEISIPWGDTHSRARFEPLVKQLRSWRPTIPTKLLRQDAVVALWFNHLVWMQMRETIGTDTSNFYMRGLPYRPTGIAV